MALPNVRSVFTALSILSLAAAAADSARASSFVLNLTTDPALGVIANVVGASMNPGKHWTSATISFSSITLDQGDDVTRNVSFSRGKSLQLQSGAYDSGLEILGFDMLPLVPATMVGESSTLTFLSGVTGNLAATLPVTGTGVATGHISG